MPDPLAPGVYPLPELEYHKDPQRDDGGSASSTTLRHILAPGSPAQVKYDAEHPKRKDAWDLGSVAHRLILGSGCDIVEVEADSWRTKDAREAREAVRAAGGVALLSEDLRAAEAMAEAVHAHPLAHALLTLQGAPEQTLIWREPTIGGDVWGRAMLDWWGDPTAGDPISDDVKTTDKGLDDDSIEKTIWQYGYHCQEDWYRRGYHAVHGVWPQFMFIFVQASPPHLVRVIEIDDELRRIARETNDRALSVWAECTRSGIWPAPGADDPTLIGPPAWVRRREASAW